MRPASSSTRPIATNWTSWPRRSCARIRTTTSGARARRCCGTISIPGCASASRPADSCGRWRAGSTWTRGSFPPGGDAPAYPPPPTRPPDRDFRSHRARSNCSRLLRRLGQFVRELLHVVDVPQRFHDRSRVDRDAARLGVGVAELPGERLDVDVDNEALVLAV